MIKDLYKIQLKKSEKPFYVLEEHAWGPDKQGRIEYFVSGVGRKKTKKFERITVDFGELEKSDSFAVGRITREYGVQVGISVCEDLFGCCRLSAETWCGFFEYCERIARDNFTEDEIKEIPMVIRKNLRSIFYGLPIVDILFLDDKLKECDPDSDYAKGAEISMKDYIYNKYGKIACDYVELLMEKDENRKINFVRSK